VKTVTDTVRRIQKIVNRGEFGFKLSDFGSMVLEDLGRKYNGIENGPNITCKRNEPGNRGRC